MGSLPQVWLFGAFLSLPFVVVAFRVRGKAGSLVTVCLAGGFSGILGYGAVAESFGEGSFGKAIREELGSAWIAHAVAAAFVPLVLTAIVLVLRRPWVRRGPR